jgi:hypothetical protein
MDYSLRGFFWHQYVFQKEGRRGTKMFAFIIAFQVEKENAEFES